MVKKTMHELAKEFPEKTYKELEKYRDADRREEAQQILIKQENEELKEEQQSPEVVDAKKEITKLKNSYLWRLNQRISKEGILIS